VAGQLLQTVAGMTAVLALLLALRPLLARRLRPQTRYALWIIVCLGLLIPFRVPLPAFWTVQAPAIFAPQTTVAAAPAETVAPLAASAGDALQTGGTAAPAQPAETAPVQTAYVAAADPSAQSDGGLRLTPYAVLLWLWAAGVAVSLGVQAVRHAAFFRRVRRWRTGPDERERRIFQEEANAVGLRRAVRLYRCAGVTSPMVAGLLRPQLLLPEIELEEDELHFVVRHELTHVRRRDLWGKALLLCCLCVHWYHPLVYVMARAMASDCEMSCDASVLANADLSERKRYGETILGVIRRQRQKQIALSTYFYEGKKDMKKRFASMFEVPLRSKGAAAIALTLVLTLLSGSVFALGDTPAETASPVMTVATDAAADAVPADWDAHRTPALFGINSVEKNQSLWSLADTGAQTPYNRRLTRAEVLRLFDLFYLYAKDDLRAATDAPVADAAYQGDTFALSAPVETFAALIPQDARTDNVNGTDALWSGAQAAGLMPFLLFPDRPMDDEQLLQLIAVVDAFDALVPYVDPYSFGDAADVDSREMTLSEMIRYWEVLDRCESDDTCRPAAPLTNTPGDGLYIKGYNGGGDTVYHYPEGREMTDDELLQIAWDLVQRRARAQAEEDYAAQAETAADAAAQPAGAGDEAVARLTALLGDVNVAVDGEPAYDAEKGVWNVSFQEVVPIGAPMYLYCFGIDLQSGDVVSASQTYWDRTNTTHSYLLGEMLTAPGSAYYVVDGTDAHWVEAAGTYLAEGCFYSGAEIADVRSDNSMNNFCVKVDYADGAKAFLFLDPVTDALTGYSMTSDEELSRFEQYTW